MEKMILFIGGLIIALFVGILTGVFGVGGGFLLTPALMIILGVPGATAVGTGLAFSEILKLNPGGRNEGIDITEEMLIRARRKAEKLGASNYRLEVGDAYNLEYGDGTFDVLINNYMFDLLPEGDFPDVLRELSMSGMEVIVEKGAGFTAGYLDDQYVEKGVKIVGSRCEVTDKADVIAQVRSLGANLDEGKADLEIFKDGQVVIGFAEPLTELDAIKQMADKGVIHFSMELMPRITRAQSMDVLSSMATEVEFRISNCLSGPV